VLAEMMRKVIHGVGVIGFARGTVSDEDWSRMEFAVRACLNFIQDNMQ